MRYPTPILTLGLALLGTSGCVSSKYQFAPKETPPPVALNLTATQPSVEAVLHSVIVYQGPGSWKRDAYWDEYVMTFTNRGPAALIVRSAVLTDFQGTTTSPGSSPWELEKQSRSYESQLLATTGNLLKIGAGAMATTSAAFAVGAAMAGGMSGYLGLGLAAVSVGVVLPAYAIGAVVRNVSSKHRIEEEFDERCLRLPLALAPGARVQGSLFFRISPGPKRLAVQCRAGNELREVAIDLSPLKNLHLASAAPAEKSLHAGPN